MMHMLRYRVVRTRTTLKSTHGLEPEEVKKIVIEAKSLQEAKKNASEYFRYLDSKDLKNPATAAISYSVTPEKNAQN